MVVNSSCEKNLYSILYTDHGLWKFIPTPTCFYYVLLNAPWLTSLMAEWDNGGFFIIFFYSFLWEQTTKCRERNLWLKKIFVVFYFNNGCKSWSHRSDSAIVHGDNLEILKIYQVCTCLWWARYLYIFLSHEIRLLWVSILDFW